MSRFFITRPRENSSITHPSVFFIPVLEYESVPFHLNHLGAFVLTSQKAARIAVDSKLPKEASYYCVGMITKNILSKNGYPFVFSPKVENVENLITFIRQTHSSAVPLCYLSGEIIKHPLDLEPLGFTCERHIVYRTVPLKINLNLLRQKDSIVFYSRRSYDLFINSAQNLKNTLKTCRAIFIFPMPDDNFKWGERLVLKTTNDMLTLIGNDYG